MTKETVYMPLSETEQVLQRYTRRQQLARDQYADPLSSFACMVRQEKERAFIRWIRTCSLGPIPDLRLLDIGCGSGSDLLMLIRLGFLPENLVGNELRVERAEIARHRLPAATRVLVGDASTLEMDEAPFDIVYQSMVFTSILDVSFRQTLAQHIWSMTRPGGGVLWYDFTFDNPANPDVGGIPVRCIRELFPGATLRRWRLTLAPPIGRRVSRIHPSLYTLFNALPLLRTHVLCWIRKPLL